MAIAAHWIDSVRECYSKHSEEEIQDLIHRLAHRSSAQGATRRRSRHRGEEGTGKGVLVQILALLGLGYLQHCKTIDGVTEQYATTYGKVVCFIDEAFSGLATTAPARS